MKPFSFVLAALVFSASVAVAQDDAPLSIQRVPQRAKSPDAFAPRGWKIEKIARGDLNRDGRADAAIVLVETRSAHVEDGVPMGRRRALVIAFNRRSNWKRVGFSSQLLLGTRGGGAFYGMTDAPVAIAIRRGVVIVGMEFGSREVTQTTHRLRWQPRRRAVYVIGAEAATRDRASGSLRSTSANYLTGQREVSSSSGFGAHQTTRKTRVSAQWKWLGAVREDDRIRI